MEGLARLALSIGLHRACWTKQRRWLSPMSAALSSPMSACQLHAQPSGQRHLLEAVFADKKRTAGVQVWETPSRALQSW